MLEQHGEPEGCTSFGTRASVALRLTCWPIALGTSSCHSGDLVNETPQNGPPHCVCKWHGAVSPAICHGIRLSIVMHWSCYKMVAVWQTKFSIFYWIKMLEYWLHFHLNLFSGAQLVIKVLNTVLRPWSTIAYQKHHTELYFYFMIYICAKTNKMFTYFIILVESQGGENVILKVETE